MPVRKLKSEQIKLVYPKATVTPASLLFYYCEETPRPKQLLLKKASHWGLAHSSRGLTMFISGAGAVAESFSFTSWSKPERDRPQQAHPRGHTSSNKTTPSNPSQIVQLTGEASIQYLNLWRVILTQSSTVTEAGFMPDADFKTHSDYDMVPQKIKLALVNLLL